jgi:hypothetical protein
VINIGTASAGYGARQVSSLLATPVAVTPKPFAGFSSSSASPESGEITGTFNLQGLLSSGMVAEVIKTQADGSLAFIDPHRLMTDQECLAREALKTQAALRSGRTTTAAVAQGITEADQALFKEMTGYNYVALESGVMVVDDQGNLAPDSPRVEAAIRLLWQASGERTVGLLQGEITADWARAVFDRFADAGDGFDRDLTDDLLAIIGR